MAVIDRVRRHVGLSKVFDDDLNGTIKAARLALIESGVPIGIADSEDNELVTEAIKCYAGAREAWEEPDIAQAQMESFQAIANVLALTYGGGKGENQ